METHHFEEEVGISGGRLELRLEVGSAKIVGGKGASAIIDAETEWMDLDLRRDENTLLLTIRVSEEARSMIGQISGFLSNRRPRAEVEITLPFDCQVDARVVTGRLSIEAIDAPVQARVTTGQLSLAHLSEAIDARVVTGQIAYQGDLSDDEHRFQVTTGSLRLELAEDTGAELDLQTVTGSIHSQRPLTGRSARHHLVGGTVRGALGDGAARVRGRVVTGNIAVGNEKIKAKMPEEVIT